jgi:Uma2 family endonuclease
MSSMPVTDPITAAEYLALDLPPRHELVDGHIVVNQPGLRHALLMTRLLVALHDWTRVGEGRGLVVVPIDVGVDRFNVYAPDVLWYGAGHAPSPDAQAPYRLPDLAVEIRSPSTWRYDIGAKKSAYEREGLPELWLVDSDAGVVVVFRRSQPASPTFDVALELDAPATLTSPLLPGFALGVAALFDLG